MNKIVRKGEKEAKIGLRSEKEIVDLINSNTEFRGLIKGSLKDLGFELKKEIKAQEDNIKTDIYIENDLQIGVSIKSSTKTSFHHIDRRRLEKWKEILTMPDEIFLILKNAILRIARNSKEKFILHEDSEEIKNYFAKYFRIIIDDIFTHGETELKILMINDIRKKRLYLFRMEEAIHFLKANIHGNITFSSKGIINLVILLQFREKAEIVSRSSFQKRIGTILAINYNLSSHR